MIVNDFAAALIVAGSATLDGPDAPARAEAAIAGSRLAKKKLARPRS